MNTATETRPFDATGWLKWSQDETAERIAPYYPAYLARRAGLDNAGEYAYNDSFTTLIDGTGSDDEGTLIYLLQTLHRRNGDERRRDAFLASGGMPIESVTLHPTKPTRGTIARFGWYMGGTGWGEVSDVRLIRHPRYADRFAFIRKGHRTPHEFDGGALYFRPEVTR